MTDNQEPSATILPLIAFKTHFQGPARLMSFDIGTKTIGIAVSDALRLVASSVETFHRGKLKDDAPKLANMMKERDIKGLVIGLPLNMDGSEGPRVQGVRDFTTALLTHPHIRALKLTVTFADERMSTVAVERQMIEHADLSRKKRDKSRDAQAAAFILQGVLG